MWSPSSLSRPCWRISESRVLLTPWDRSNLTGFCCQAWMVLIMESMSKAVMTAESNMHTQPVSEWRSGRPTVRCLSYTNSIYWGTLLENTHTNPLIRAQLTIILLKAIFTNFNLILGLKHTPVRCTRERSSRHKPQASLLRHRKHSSTALGAHTQIYILTLKKSSWWTTQQLGRILVSLSVRVVLPPFVTLRKETHTFTVTIQNNNTMSRSMRSLVCHSSKSPHHC